MFASNHILPIILISLNGGFNFVEKSDERIDILPILCIGQWEIENPPQKLPPQY